MTVYINTNFTGFWPVGTSAVIVAANPEEAVHLLNLELVKIGLVGDAVAEEMIEINSTGVTILNDGQY